MQSAKRQVRDNHTLKYKAEDTNKEHNGLKQKGATSLYRMTVSENGGSFYSYAHLTTLLEFL